MGMNVLSLCDGMSCGQIALKELGITVDKYYSSEIDKNAIKVTMDNFTNTIQLGDVTKITEDMLKELPKIDLVIFGSPCISLTKATLGRDEYHKGLKGASGLFYSCNDILQWIKKKNNPNTYFLIENVDSDKTADLAEMSRLVGVEPILIDSNLFSAQNRSRNYWTNIPIKPLPKECDLVLKDILDDEVDEKFYYKQDYDFHGFDKSTCATLHMKGHDILKRVTSPNFKSPTLTTCGGGNTQKKVFDKRGPRKLTPNEYRKLQTIPDWYKMDVANTHCYNLLGNGWTVKTIMHIFSGMEIDKND